MNEKDKQKLLTEEDRKRVVKEWKDNKWHNPTNILEDNYVYNIPDFDIYNIPDFVLYAQCIDTIINSLNFILDTYKGNLNSLDIREQFQFYANNFLQNLTPHIINNKVFTSIIDPHDIECVCNDVNNTDQTIDRNELIITLVLRGEALKRYKEYFGDVVSLDFILKPPLLVVNQLY